MYTKLHVFMHKGAVYPQFFCKMLLITLLFLMCGSLQGQNSLSKVTLNLKNVPLVEILKQIERQTAYSVVYRDVVIDKTENASISVTNVSLNDVLTGLLNPKGLTFGIVDKYIVILAKEKNMATSDNKSIRVAGVVKDNKGEMIVGANIRVKGTNMVVVSDMDGKFAVDVSSPEAVLLVSYIGFKTREIPVGNGAPLNIVLNEDASSLSEVVVVGYGMQKKIHVTGSVAQLSSKELLVAPMSSVTNMLAGKLPGLITTQNSGQPGNDQASMIIRGAGTFNDSSPLLLVDGVERSFNTIDPNDVESVTILKDAAAAAVYGVRAAHGVILVKTKRGIANRKPEITYNGSYTFTMNTRFPEFLNGPDYARWHNKARELDGYEGFYTAEDIAKIENGDPDGIWGNTDWLGELFKDYGGTQQHNISVIGGSDRVQYFVSAGFMDQDGILPNSEFKRYNVRSNLDVQVTDEIKLSVDIAGRKEERDNPGFAIDPNNGYNPITQAIRALPIIPKEYDGLPAATGDGARTWSPLAAVNQSGFNKNDRNVFESSGTLEYKAPFLRGLTLKMFFSYDRNFTEDRNFLDTYNVSKFDPATKIYTVTKAEGTGTSSLWQAASNGSLMMGRPSIEYNNVFGKHTVGALFLYEYEETKGSSFQAQRQNYILNAIPELTFAQEDTPNSIKGSSSKTKIAGYVGRLNYMFDQKYLAEFAFRYDGSYKFHKDYRWGFFPSLSLGWIISEEEFFKEKYTKINKLKLRASVGELGRDNIDAFLYKRYFNLTTEPAYAFGTTPTPSYAFYSSNSVPSYDLTWEKTRTMNVGAEFMAYDGLISASLDVFYKYTYDILQGVSGIYPPSISNNYPTIENSGKVDVRGFELELGHQNKIGQVSYSLNGNLTWARNKLLARAQEENIQPWMNQIGQPLGGVYGLHAIGLYQTEEQLNNRPTGPGGVQRLGDLMYQDYNQDGKVDWDDLIRIARSHTPEMVFSLSGNVTYKGFDANFQLQGAAICDVITSGLYPSGVMDQTEFARAFYAGGNSPYYLVENSWTPDHTNAKYPRLGVDWNGNNGWASDWWVVDGSYLRMKSAQIGYTLPKQIASKINAQRLRIYVAGTNLFTIDALDYMDPEMPSNNNGYYPQQRTFSMGLDLTF